MNSAPSRSPTAGRGHWRRGQGVGQLVERSYHLLEFCRLPGQLGLAAGDVLQDQRDPWRAVHGSVQAGNRQPPAGDERVQRGQDSRLLPVQPRRLRVGLRRYRLYEVPRAVGAPHPRGQARAETARLGPGPDDGGAAYVLNRRPHRNGDLRPLDADALRSGTGHIANHPGSPAFAQLADKGTVLIGDYTKVQAGVPGQQPAAAEKGVSQRPAEHPFTDGQHQTAAQHPSRPLTAEVPAQ